MMQIWLPIFIQTGLPISFRIKKQPQKKGARDHSDLAVWTERLFLF